MQSLHLVTCSLKTLLIFCPYCANVIRFSKAINCAIAVPTFDCVPLWNPNLSAVMRVFLFVCSLDIHLIRTTSRLSGCSGILESVVIFVSCSFAFKAHPIVFTRGCFLVRNLSGCAFLFVLIEMDSEGTYKYIL